MKWLLGLSAVQTLLLAMLGLHALKLDMRTDEIAAAVTSMKTGAQNDPAGAEPLQWADAAPAQTISADVLRMIIREELEAIAAEPGAAPAARTVQSQAAPQKAANYDQGQTLLTQTAIDQDIDRYKKRGAISPVEMDALHAKIAELPPEARRAALIRLTKAINSGEIKGQF